MTCDARSDCDACSDCAACPELLSASGSVVNDMPFEKEDEGSSTSRTYWSEVVELVVAELVMEGRGGVRCGGGGGGEAGDSSVVACEEDGTQPPDATSARRWERGGIAGGGPSDILDDGR